MTSRDFCYWLQGYLEISAAEGSPKLTPAQVDAVQKHLSLVFKHEIDPSAGPPELQAELDKIHTVPPIWNPGPPISGNPTYRC